MPTPRNPYAWAPIMRKGGAHTHSRSGQRFNASQSLHDEIEDYIAEKSDFEHESIGDSFHKDS